MAVPLMIAATAMQVVGSIQQGEAAASAAEYNQKVSYNNAILSERQAKLDESRQRVQAKKQLGGIRAAYSASGVQLEGSPLDVLQESAGAAELDSLIIRHGGKLRAAAYRNEGDLSGYEANNARNSGYLSAASSLLSGGSKVYGNAPTNNGYKAPKYG